MKRFAPLIFFSLCTMSLMAQQTMGLFLNDSLSQNGYTLFTPSSSKKTYLIDNCGYKVKEWTSNYPPGLSVYLLENGHLLRTARIASAFNSGGTGGRLEEYDWEGNFLWGYDYSNADHHQHHDIAPLPNGNVLLLAWEVKSKEEAIAAGRDPEAVGSNGIWMEHLVELKPVGVTGPDIVWEWHAWDHLVQNIDSTKNNYGIVENHPELFDFNFTIGGGTDWMHANSVDYNPHLDQIVLSSRNWSEFWVIDHSTTTEEAADHSGGQSAKGGDVLYRWGNPQTYGRGTSADQKLFGQHHVHWIPEGLPDEGKIMIFNNGANRPDGTYSSVDVIETPVDQEGRYLLASNTAYGPDQLYWSYRDTPAATFFSNQVSGSQRLPNGNTLICEGNSGTFFEVTSDGDKVWEYINPIRQNGPMIQGQIISGNGVFRATRYMPDFPAFTDQLLTPGAPLELQPLDYDCTIFDVMTAVDYTSTSDIETVQFSPNPFEGEFSISHTTGEIIQLEIIDLTGRVMVAASGSTSPLLIHTSHWTPGMYLVCWWSEDREQMKFRKIIKY